MKDWERRRLEEAKPAYEALMKFYPLTLEDLDGEDWKPFVGYEVSNYGRVKTFKYQLKILKPSLCNGYLRVVLFKDGKRNHFLVHRLVAEAFIPNPDNKPQINHIDGNKFNNYVGNLEWTTAHENTQHSYDTGLQIAPQGEGNYKAKLTTEQVEYVRNNPDNLSRKELAEKFGLEPSGISAIQLGKTYRNAGGDIRESRKPRVPDEIREQIRADYATGNYTYVQLAHKYGVHPMTIRRIIHEK